MGAFKDTFKKMFPKYNPKTEFMQFFGANLVSGGLAAAGSLTIVYPLDYSRTRLASDVGSGKKTFSGLFDCMKKTAAGPGGFGALYTGFGVSVIGIVGYRGLQLGCFDQSLASTHTKRTRVFWGPCPRSLQHRLRSPLVLELRIPSTLCVDACRCSRRNPSRSISTRAPWTASRRSLPRRAWPRACTRDSLRTSLEAWEALSCLCFTIARRRTWACEEVLSEGL